MKNFQILSFCLLSLFTFSLSNNIQASQIGSMQNQIEDITSKCPQCGGTCGAHKKPHRH
ncbi:MAG: hypothetical protein ACXU9U_03620 [Parachlamydiaceae bacterium]